MPAPRTPQARRPCPLVHTMPAATPGLTDATLEAVLGLGAWLAAADRVLRGRASLLRFAPTSWGGVRGGGHGRQSRGLPHSLEDGGRGLPDQQPPRRRAGLAGLRAPSSPWMPRGPWGAHPGWLRPPFPPPVGPTAGPSAALGSHSCCLPRPAGGHVLLPDSSWPQHPLPGRKEGLRGGPPVVQQAPLWFGVCLCGYGDLLGAPGRGSGIRSR